MKQRLHLGVVVVCAALAIIAALLRGGTSVESIVTMLLAVELTIRFRYVIGLLDWPVSASRLALLVGFWVGLVVFGWETPHPDRWALIAAGLFAIGVLIEVHNLVTRQWLIGDATFQRSLRNDILRGITAAAFATIATVLVSRRWPEWTALFVGGLIVADVARFLEMVVRHRRLALTDANRLAHSGI